MKKTAAVLLCAVLMLLPGGCVQAPPQSAGQELARHSWGIEQPGAGRECTLDFSADSLTFSAKGFGEPVELSGYYYVSESDITVMSDTLGTVCFDYRLSGNKLILSYSGREVVLNKRDMQSSLVQN